ncbi:MAG: phospholipase D-like domain-containing protein, partial [Acidobacteriota bacterium]|nr:phospholipase D-like domain-containing protein [Acidobacteriota bacterium]
MSQSVSRYIRSATLLLLLLAGTVSSANAQHRLCDPGAEDCREILISYIRAEKVGLDLAFWFMEDSYVAGEVIKRHQAGIPVRVLMDTQANATTPRNIERLAELQAAGISMREKVTGGILHWKMMLFAGQNIVEFSGANYSSDAWLPAGAPYVNYVDEGILFTSKASVVNSFKTKFDDLWTNTTDYQNYANVSGPLRRAHGSFVKDPELNFPPVESYATRSVQSYYAETQRIDAIMYRITDRRHSDALIEKRQSGMPIRLITEPQQYRDPKRLWHSWNVDRLYMAGVQIKHRAHAGLNHQKSVLLYGSAMTIFGSSNWTSPSAESQEEHNYFTREPAIFRWFVDQFERKWNNAAGVTENLPFAPLPPDVPADPAPAERTSNVATGSASLSWVGGPWAHEYDVYLGTNSGNLPLIGSRLPLGPSNSSGQRQSFVVPTALQPNTLYYWRVVGRTAAEQTTASPVWSFVTGGQGTGGTPTVTLDLTSLSFGATMRTGSFESASGAQTVRLRRNGTGQIAWIASASEPWITVAPSSGSGDGDLVVGIRYVPGLPTSGEVRGIVVVDVTGAANALPPIQVVLRLSQTGLATEPFGSFDTPVDGSRNVTGSIAVTGWALDDLQVTSVRIYRNCLPIDAGRCQNALGEQLFYIADAGFVEGSRPDVQASHPSLPNSSRAGWGYL